MRSLSRSLAQARRATLVSVLLLTLAFVTGCRFDPRNGAGTQRRAESPVASPVGTIPVMAVVTPTAFIPGATPEPGVLGTPTLPATNPATYVVAQQDTLYGIALKFGVALAALIELNGLSDPNDIQVGQELKIPPR